MSTKTAAARDTQFSAKVRSRTERADFFRVMDHYLEQDDVRAIMTRTDLDNYQQLVRRYIVIRAANLILMGDFSRATLLLNDFYKPDVVGALSDRRDLVVFLLGIYLKMTKPRG